MIFSTRTISDLLYNSAQMLDIASGDDVVKAALYAANFDDTKIANLKLTWGTADTKTKEYSNAVAVQKEAKITFKRVFKESHGIYMQHVKFARSIGRKDPERNAKLNVTESRKMKFNEWMLQASDFYAKALVDEGLIMKYTTNYGITKEQLESGNQAVLKAIDAKEKYKTAMGNVQALKVERDKALEALANAIKDFAMVCIYALKDNTQQLEKMGIRVYSPGYHKKNKETTEQEKEGQED